MPTIIPRWEWRTFGDRFGRANAAFTALKRTGVQDSDELYLLSGGGPNVKVRDDLMDIKVLREVDADGLERWEPVLKAGFPLTQPDAVAVAQALVIPEPTASGGPWDVKTFLDAYAGPDGPIRAVKVHKHRVRYLVHGCTSEISDVTVDGRTVRTIAIESEDPEAVRAAVASVGLVGYRNVSYPKGLAALLDGAPPRYAVIDVGTNSVKFHLAEARPRGGWRTVSDRAEVTRLGEGLADTGAISDAAASRTADAIKGMADEAAAAGALATVAVGTAGLRMASNSTAVLEAIRERSGVTIEVISGEDESRLAYLAVVAGLSTGTGAAAVFDTGGGSSQFTFGRGGSVDERFSVNVGAARYTERFGLEAAVPRETLDAACQEMRADLSRLDGRRRPDRLIGMGGAVTNLTAVALAMATYEPERVQGATLERTEIDRQIEQYRKLDADGRRSIVGLQPNRAEVILAGACIVRTIMEALDQTSFTVSDRGLRHGVLLERFGTADASGGVA
jgi:exopolyphosphatase / guanosine-5'-triphosphate,3'-diphosphate pyrophosphatase